MTTKGADYEKKVIKKAESFLALPFYVYMDDLLPRNIVDTRA
jgi:hypothetical protein